MLNARLKKIFYLTFIEKIKTDILFLIQKEYKRYFLKKQYQQLNFNFLINY